MNSSRRLDVVCAAALFVAAAAYFASFAPWTRPVLLDAATWDSMALETARGLIPYRDVFLHKTPGAALIGAFGAWLGTHLGVEPVLAAHTLFLFLGALAPVLLFALCRSSRLPRGAALAVAVALIAYDEWPIAALEGCRPKVPTVVFGLASMLAAENDAGFTSSLLGGISVLCWQPGLAFLLGSWAAIAKRGERRLTRFTALAIVSVLPAIAMLTWLAAHGALRDFFEESILFNFHYIADKARTPSGTLKALVRTIHEWNSLDALLVPAALAGLWRLRAGRRAARNPEAAARSSRPSASAGSYASPGLPLSVVVSGAIYTAMTFVSYQSWPDAILLGPIVATMIGAGLYWLLRSRLDANASALIAVVVLALGTVPDTKPKFHPPIDFTAQRAAFRSLAEGLGPDDRVVGVSVPEFFVHTGRRNGWKWPYLWFGVDDFAADRHAGGFDGILADLDEDRPAMLLVARLWIGPQRAKFERWASTRYDVQTMHIFPHLKRPLRVYRLRSDQR